MNITSKRLDYSEAKQLLGMMGISEALLFRAGEEGEASIKYVTVRKTPLEGLFTIQFHVGAEG